MPNTNDKKMFDVGFRLVRIANNKGRALPQHRKFSLKNALTNKKEKTSNAEEQTTELPSKEKQNDVTSTNAPAKRPQMLTSDFSTTINTNSSLTEEDLAQEADDKVEEEENSKTKSNTDSSPDSSEEP